MTSKQSASPGLGMIIAPGDEMR